MAVIQTPDYFGNAFAQSFAQSRAYAERAQREEEERKRNEASWNKYAETFVPQQPMETQAMPVATSIPGQSGVTTQPSAMPTEQPTVSTEQVNMPSKDPYKQLEYQTGKEFAAKLQAMSQLQPQERQMAMRQLWQEREATLANARYDKFSQDMEGIMAEYNPADPVASHKAKAKAIALGRRLKIDTGDVLKLFEQDKPIAVAAGTTLINPRTMQPMYTAPREEKPATEYEKWKMTQPKAPTGNWDTIIDPDSGDQYKVNRADPSQRVLLKKADPSIKALKELDSAEKREMDYLEKSAKPGQFATPDQLKAYQAQVKALQQKYQGLREGLKKPATTPQGEKPPMTMDMVLEAITKQGEDATRKKLASVYGEEEAERWVGRARNYR